MRLLIELLRPAGAESARRWVAALLLVPEEEREAVIERVETSIVRTYAADEAPTGARPRAGDDA